MAVSTPILSILCTLLSFSAASNVALISSSGCYSHDVMMREVGGAFEAGTNITWIQTHVYKFGHMVELPAEWNKVVVDGFTQEVREFVPWMSSIVWEQHIPNDLEKPWKWKGPYGFLMMLQYHQTNCEKMLQSPQFRAFREQKVDIVVLDHFLQECMGALSSLLDAPTVQFSNYPVADGYITYHNVPSSPAAYPRTATKFSGQGMSMWDRMRNTYFDLIIRGVRTAQSEAIRRVFLRNGYEIDVPSLESRRPIYAGRSEFLFEVIRPISNRIKNFGCSSCSNLSSHVISLPSTISNTPSPSGSPPSRGSLTLSALSPNGTSYLGHPCESMQSPPVLSPNGSTYLRHPCESKQSPTVSASLASLRSFLFSSVDEETVRGQRRRIAEKWRELRVEKLDEAPFVVASFGSVVKIDEMPAHVLSSFLSAFSLIPHRVIWQISGDVEKRMKGVVLPENVVVTSWMPMKELLAHPNIHYVITHGGINTMNEIIAFAVPAIGFPTQGDQYSNCRRFVDLGVGEMGDIYDLLEGRFEKVIVKFERNVDRYWKRALKFSQMVKDYRTLAGNDQGFWIDWTRRHARRLEQRTLFRMEYLGDMESTFLYIVLSSLLITVGFLSL